ncbi:magnesium-translocating P-type ATPase [Methanoregula sp.]|jgi:P-type Mg2+ transporter|uniref:magnesium-translocating P-type ATPase n=1 Tax=Methanoregula sp. TaxID=2052170 RepID=UPI003C1D955A
MTGQTPIPESKAGKPDQQFHTIPEEELFSALSSSPAGLTEVQAGKNRAVYGPNDISHIRKRPVILQFLAHFKNLLVIILLFAAVVSVVTGEITDAAIIFVIIFASVTLDFFQEYKAENAAELLKKKIITRASVFRDGKAEELPITDLVPGDLVSLAAGDIIPADARLLSSRDLYVNQSSLTGEPFPVAKTAERAAPGERLAEAGNYVFLGTSVVSGMATAMITRTGAGTEFGKVAKTLVERPPETEFERGLRHFSYLMSKIVFSLVIIVFFINALFKHDVLQSLIFSVALAVGMTPELLPMILSLNLSKGALAMSEKGAIVKHPESIQNFGSMDVLCTDKTGTLTDNQIALVRHLDAEGNDSDTVLHYSYLNSYFQTGLKSPLDEAILNFRHIDIDDFTKNDEIPFDFVRRRVSIVATGKSGKVIVSKGAPEEILRVCTSVEKDGAVQLLTDAGRDRITALYHSLSADGFRALAVCYRPLDPGTATFSVADEKEMVLVGLITFIDPPKESARESIRLLAQAGIELKILSGDNELVTKKTCELIGLGVKGVLTGTEIDAMDVQTLSRQVEHVTIFSRMTPAQKNRVMQAIRHNGHVVGFMGDGINDAPSIREADVGISVENAVDIAKESADIILLKNDLRILHDGVLEGRKTFGNTMKYILMGTSSNFGNMFSVAGASLFLKFLPMLPIQILLNNLMYDVSESTIPTDNVDDSYISTPKKWDIDFIKKFIMVFGPISSIFDFITFLILLVVFQADAPFFQTAWFVESICTQTLVIFVIRTRVVPFYQSRPSRMLFASTILIVLIACVLPFTVIGSLFGFVQLPVSFYAVLAGLVIGYLILVEMVKYWFFRKFGGSTERRLVPDH